MQIKEFLLSQIAKLHYGNKFDKNKMTYTHPDVNFVSRTSVNNGISDVVDRIDGVTPYPAGCVSLAFGGSIGSCFLQDRPFYTGQNVGVIEFSSDVQHEAKLYFVTALEKVCKAKYVTFSDEINKHFKTDLAVSLPFKTVVIPDWVTLATLLKCHGGAEMSKIDTSSWKKFKISELFGNAKLGKYHNPADLHPDPDGYDFICASNLNNGINKDMPKVNGEQLLLTSSNIIAWGKQCPMFTYHKNPCVTSQGMYYIELPDTVTEEMALFIITLLEHACSGNYGYNNCLIGSKFDELEISLPVTTQEVPDWDYMQERIAELEQERIAELEQERIAELEQYLVAAGLNDYTLTDDDLKLSLSGFGRDKDGNPAAHAAVSKPMIQFRMGDLFEKQELKCRLSDMDKRRDTSTVFGGEYVIPLVNAKHGDNGIQYYGRQGEWDTVDKSICIVSNGAIATGDVYPEPQITGVLWDAYLVKCKHDDVSDELLMYFAGAIEKAIKLVFDWGNKAVWNKVQHEFVQLPVQTDESGAPVIDEAKAYHPNGYVPDWEYMAAYIRAMEKLAIRDVVDYKDEFIRQHRMAVAGSGV